MKETFCCPRCGRGMAEGKMPAGWNHHLEWNSSCDIGAWKRFMMGPPFRKEGSLESGFYLVPRGNPLGVVYLPAYICTECRLVLLDYAPEKIELDSKTAQYFTVG